MSTPTLPEDPVDTLPAEERIEERLSRLELMTQRAAREGRSSGRAFMIFAVCALLIAVVNLVVIAAKLDGTSSPTQASRPAATAAQPAVAGRVSVGLREFTLTPSPASASARAGHVTFAVSNRGAIGHEFVVLRTSKPAADLLKGAEADETGNVGEIGGIAPGQTKTLALTLTPGHYALICNLPGHYAAGQHADLTVR
jgi:uncharacterized cupredoxin-like copper-binding protein